MANWKYKLYNEGLKLRELVTESKEAEIIEQIEVCCKSLASKLTKEDRDYFEDRIEELLNLLEGEAETIKK